MFDELNDTELWEMARVQLTGAWGRPIRLKRSLPRERVIELIENNLQPATEEMVLETRFRLEQWVAKNWEGVNSQLPCRGLNRGKCTVFPCPDGRHFACFLEAREHMI